MEKTKKILNLLNNQYFKSFKRFENTYPFASSFKERAKEFNSDYLNLVAAVLSGDANQIYEVLTIKRNWLYVYATYNEQEKLNFELLENFSTNH